MRVLLTAVTPVTSSNMVVEAPDAMSPEATLEALAAQSGHPGSPVVLPPKPGLITGDDKPGLRYGVKAGIGVEVAPPPLPGGFCLVIVSGPATGAVFGLPAGDHVVGRAGDIVLQDQALSRRHACLSVGYDGTIQVEDLGSANGTFVEGVKAETGSKVPVLVGDAIALGETVVEVRLVGVEAAVIEPGEPGWINFVRPPRIVAGYEPGQVDFPAEPPKPNKRAFPLISLVVPLLFGGVMAFLMGNARYLLFMLMSPLMMVANMLTERRSGGQQAKADAATYADRLQAAKDGLRVALTAEKQHLRGAAPDAVAAYLAAVVPSRRLWERRPGDQDFLTLRVGTTTLDSAVRAGGLDERPQACDVPVTVNLRQHRVLGVAGPSTAAVDKLLSWLVVQLAAWHAPRDVQLSYLSAKTDESWGWLVWLPQMRDDENADAPLARFACGEKAVADSVAWLQEVVKARQAVASSGASFTPHIVVIRGYRTLRLTLGLSQVLKDGPAVGVYAICSDEQERALPEECEAVFTLPLAESAVGTLACQGHPVINNVLSEQVTPLWCDLVARELAPLHDIGTEEHSSALPNASRLLDVLHLDGVTGETIAAGWQAGGRSTKAVIGELADGVFTVDIRADGPHGLVAGTTGSGKSELLQTLVASLSVANRPDEMNFVLIDYKGGAAFKDCARLPHTVGTVTDLDGHLTTRALESLAAELRRREHQLATLGAKDIEDYLAAKTEADAPMPRLLIIIDEFAALVQELPDFVAGLIDIARRGRSLGVHLILATQRPAGVVNAEIKSNTNLRIALRVTDAADSADVIEAPDAAHISKSTPGRAYARLGHSSLIAFQSSRVGGRPASAVTEAATVRPVGLGELCRPLPRAEVEEDTSVPTDLARLVDACREAAALTGIATPPSPWLDALPALVDLGQLFAEFPETTGMVEKLVVPFGLTDLPSQQRRDVAAFDIMAGVNLSIIGAGRSGRSSVLRAIAMVIAQHMSPADVQLYAMDAGGNALLPLEKLPHVGAVVLRDQTERIFRLQNLLRSVIVSRQQQLAAQGFANLREQWAATDAAHRLPYIVLFLDSWDIFYQTYENMDGGALVRGFLQIAQEGPGVGITMVVTGEKTLLSGRMANFFPDKLMLRMTDPSDYSYIGMPVRSAPAVVPPGRGFLSQGLTETQVALVASDPAGPAQVAALQAAGAEAAARWQGLPTVQKPGRVDILPARFNMSDVGHLPVAGESKHLLPVGVGGDTLSLIGLDAVEDGPGFLVAGPRRSGRSTTLKTIALFALARGWQVVTVTLRASLLQQLPPHENLQGPFDGNTAKDELTAVLADLRAKGRPSLVLVDDIELVAYDHWLSLALEDHLSALRDTESALVVAGTAAEMSGGYRGIVFTLKKGHSGVMLSPQVVGDPEMFGTSIAKSAIGQTVPPGSGYLVRIGESIQAQVIYPDVTPPDKL